MKIYQQAKKNLSEGGSSRTTVAAVVKTFAYDWKLYMHVVIVLITTLIAVVGIGSTIYKMVSGRDKEVYNPVE